MSGNKNSGRGKEPVGVVQHDEGTGHGFYPEQPDHANYRQARQWLKNQVSAGELPATSSYSIVRVIEDGIKFTVKSVTVLTIEE